MSYAVYVMDNFRDQVGSLVGFYSGPMAYGFATTAASIAMLTHDLVEVREVPAETLQEN